MKKIKILFLDGASILNVSYHANLPQQMMYKKTEEEKSKYYNLIHQTKGGVYTNGVYVMLRAYLKMIRLYKPDKVAIAWDVDRNTFRRELYPEYKAQRKPTAIPLKEQFETAQKLFEALGVYQIKDSRYEADDFLGTLAEKFKSDDNTNIAIWTKDKDALQLIDDNVSILLSTSKASELNEKYNISRNDIPNNVFEINIQNIEEEYGVSPEGIIELKALMGDAGDNIPGVKRLGEKSAIPLIKEYQCIENLYDNIEGLDNKEIKELNSFWKNDLGILKSPYNALTKESETELVGKKSAIISKKLATIKRDIEISTTIDDLSVTMDKQKALEMLDMLELQSLKEEINKL